MTRTLRNIERIHEERQPKTPWDDDPPDTDDLHDRLDQYSALDFWEEFYDPDPNSWARYGYDVWDALSEMRRISPKEYHDNLVDFFKEEDFRD